MTREPMSPRPCALQQEKSLGRESRGPQLESSPHSPLREERPGSKEEPSQPPVNKYIKRCFFFFFLKMGKGPE